MLSVKWYSISIIIDLKPHNSLYSSGLSLTFQVGGERKKVGGDKEIFFGTLIW